MPTPPKKPITEAEKKKNQYLDKMAKSKEYQRIANARKSMSKIVMPSKDYEAGLYKKAADSLKAKAKQDSIKATQLDPNIFKKKK